jgi:hypothetical protein
LLAESGVNKEANMKKLTIIILTLLLTFAFVMDVSGETFRQGDVRKAFNPVASTTKTSAYTVTSSDSLVNVTCSSADIVITLPTLTSLRSTFGNKTYKILKTDATAYNVIVTPGTNDTIGGESTRYINAQNAYVVISMGSDDGTGTGGGNWEVLFESAYVVEDYEAGTVTINAEQTLNGDVTVTGTTPSVTIGDGGAEDNGLFFNNDAPATDDYYFASDDTNDYHIWGQGSTIGTDQRISIVNGTTETKILYGDATEEDITHVDDGNAQDFHRCLDDTDDDMKFGVGATCGTNTALSIDEDAVVSITNSVMYPAETVTAANTLTSIECGKTFFLNSGTEFATTLPAISTISAGCYFKFVIVGAPSGASYTIITGNSLENVLTGGFVERETDTGDDGPYQVAGDTITSVDGVGAVGDMVEMISDGSIFYVTGIANTDGGLTITQAD